MKLVVAIAILALACALCALGQTTISIEPYAAGYLSTTPHSAGGVNILAGSATASVVSYTSYEMRPLSLKTTPVAVGRTGVQWTVASNSRFDLSILGQAGGAGSNSAVSLAAAFGGKLVYLPGFKTIPGMYFTGSLQGVGQSAVLGGWNPEVTVGAGYSISGLNLGTLSSRRREAAKVTIK